jgi:hypothetical protein
VLWIRNQHTFGFLIPDPDPESGLRIRDVYPGSRILIYPSRIPDPKTATKERGEKKFVVITFYVATNFTKLHRIPDPDPQHCPESWKFTEINNCFLSFNKAFVPSYGRYFFT